MYKILSIIPTIFLSSCFFGNNIVVDESENRVLRTKPVNTIYKKTINKVRTISKADMIDITDERRIISKNDDEFSIKNIAGNIKYIDSKSSINKFKNKVKMNDKIAFVINFDFNSTQLSDASKKIIVMHRDFLIKNPMIKLFLEGHTDIKGSREYNLSLGENRSLSVKKFLNINSKNISVVSFGEEKTISNIDSKNRRVEFIYK